ncbi:hypothetical protein ACA910_001891 [Epithemia clementina (nom. ined.)]
MGHLALSVNKDLHNAEDNILICIEKLHMEMGKSTEAILEAEHQAPTIWEVLSALFASVTAIEATASDPSTTFHYARQSMFHTLEIQIASLEVGIAEVKRGKCSFVEQFWGSMVELLQKLARKLKDFEDSQHGPSPLSSGKRE